MEDFEKKIMPGVLHWNHPNFFAYFGAGNAYPSVLGDMLSSGIAAIGFSWVSFMVQCFRAKNDLRSDGTLCFSKSRFLDQISCKDFIAQGQLALKWKLRKHKVSMKMFLKVR